MTAAGRSIEGPIRLGVCVDDFGLNGWINEAALKLALAGRISALSCLVDAPAWPSGAALLDRPMRQRVDVGLHLNLTESFDAGRSRPSIAAWVARTSLGISDADALGAEIRRQLDRFEDTFGAAPDFVDGHQHVHQLAGVREALLTELVRRAPDRLPWLRRTRPPRATGLRERLDPGRLKHALIAALGERRLAQAARRGGFRQNRHLLGVYGFGAPATDYAARLSHWCRQAEDRDLLMCHPATGAGGHDIIAAARCYEYSVLSGAHFADLLAARAAVVTRLSIALSEPPAQPDLP